MFTYCTLFESRILTSLFKIGNLISRHTYIIINKMELKMRSISFTYLHFCLLFQMSCKTQNENKKTRICKHVFAYLSVLESVFNHCHIYFWMAIFYFKNFDGMLFCNNTFGFSVFHLTNIKVYLYLDSNWKLKNTSKYISLKDECLFIETDYDYYNFLSLRPTFYSLSTESFKSSKNEIIIFWLVELS